MDDRPYTSEDLADMERKRGMEEPDISDKPPSWPAPLTETGNTDGLVYFVNRWLRPIPVAERLPDEPGFYLVCECHVPPDSVRNMWVIAGYDGLIFFGVDFHQGKAVFPGKRLLTRITHWLPLPPKPE